MTVAHRGSHPGTTHELINNNATAKPRHIRLRELGNEALAKRSELLDQYKQASGRGNKAKASKLKVDAAKQYKLSQDYFWKSAQCLIEEKNTSPKVFDLHGLSVEHAICLLKRRIYDGIQRGEKEVGVIVGRGTHSANGVPKLKPAVLALCEEAGFKTQIEPKNPGLVDVVFFGKKVPISWKDAAPSISGAPSRPTSPDSPSPLTPHTSPTSTNQTQKKQDQESQPQITSHTSPSKSSYSYFPSFQESSRVLPFIFWIVFLCTAVYEQSLKPSKDFPNFKTTLVGSSFASLALVIMMYMAFYVLYAAFFVVLGVVRFVLRCIAIPVVHVLNHKWKYLILLVLVGMSSGNQRETYAGSH